jgi:hypothetical protein
MFKMARWMAVAVLAGFWLAGCAKKENLQPEPTPEASESMAQSTTSTAQTGQGGNGNGSGMAMPTAAPTPSLSRYTVKKGDSLWKISAKQDVLGDPFRWPLLFKANRDQILDPDIIEPSQELGYEAYYSPKDAEEAIGKAKETPAYQPHSKPRRQLPVKY